MVEKSKCLQKEVRRLTLIMADIFEALPQAGDDRDGTWEKIGFVKALVHKGLLGDAWLDMSFGECNEAVKAVLPEIRAENARWLVPVPKGGEA